MHRNPWDPAKSCFNEYEVQSLKPSQLSSEVSTYQVRPNFFSLTIEDLKAIFEGQGKEQFRSQQVFKWVYEKRTTDPEKMSNLSKSFRAELGNLFDFSLPPVATHLKSIDGTQKFLFDMGQGMTVEAVLIPSDGRLTLCISSEIGCNMACRFCFTGKQKLKRRLQTGEIVGQFMQVHDRLGPDERISNIVFMGMGEPLDNPEAVFKSIEILHSTWGMNVSKKRVTVSTSGIVPEMWRIAASKVRLAVSLNGPDDAIRTQVMPINKRWPLAQLLSACKEYTRATRDKVTFEYVLLKGVTDQIEHARKLYKLTRDVPCKINIIPFNEHPGTGFERPDDSQVALFHKELMNLGAHVLLRRTMGRDIFAACGQLTSAYEEHPKMMDISNSTLGGLRVTDSRGGQLSL
ncbi:MAG: 23S rRNA (adenine(2503)-C(2))-methyltransferase RlmN [Bdellovibrionaceae bacterium]|nr:23S rRNA (adenine(2503)-C(2))-methyltransferase RlmN [Pseudobdellovibrionaceae bacterium]